MTIKQKLKKLNMGTMRVHFFRAKLDLSVIQTAIVVYLGYKAGMDWKWLLFVPLYVLYKIRDVKEYMTQEIDYNFKKSTMSMQMYAWCKENNEMLKKLKKTNEKT